MAGSEMGDGDNPDTPSLGNKGQRISAREKRPVNYNNMVQGTGDFSASMDYNEVSGLNSRAL